MNLLLTCSLLLAVLIVMLCVIFVVRRRRSSKKRQTGHRSPHRFQQQRFPGIQPLILRASRPRRAVHPPAIQVLPQAIAPSPTPEEQQAIQKQAASQTTVYALPVFHTLKPPSCPRCSKQTTPHDIFCGACGMRLHRSTQSRE